MIVWLVQGLTLFPVSNTFSFFHFHLYLSLSYFTCLTQETLWYNGKRNDLKDLKAYTLTLISIVLLGLQDVSVKKGG